MGKLVIYFFVKTFEKTSYAESFLDGLLYLNTLSYFESLEKDADEAARSDSNEAVFSWLQPNQTEITINFNGVDVKIDSSDLAAPVSIKSNYLLNKNIFCIHASYVGGSAPSEFQSCADFEDHLKISKENIVLGQHSVIITNPEIFISRVKKAVEQKGFRMQASIVDYYDPQTFHGDFDENIAIFKKQSNFKHQKEYRIAIESNNNGLPLVLDIGSIRDIAQTISIEDINNGIKITPLEK